MKIDTNKNARIERIGLLLQPPRLSKEDTGLLSGVFSDTPDIYVAMRDLFFGFELDDNQKSLLAEVKKISSLIRKIFLPEVKKGIPFGNTFDLWQTKDLQEFDNNNVYIKAKLLLIKFLETSLARLEDTSLKGVDLTIDPEPSFIIGRNGYINYIDSQIRFLIQHVNIQTLSPEEQRTLMAINSNK